jgi:hypothetical protein
MIIDVPNTITPTCAHSPPQRMRMMTAPMGYTTNQATPIKLPCAFSNLANKLSPPPTKVPCSTDPEPDADPDPDPDPDPELEVSLSLTNGFSLAPTSALAKSRV